MNTVQFFEIHVDNPKRAIDFYTNVFGWEFVKTPNPTVEYWEIRTKGINGGLLKRPYELTKNIVGSNAFVNSIQVENFDDSAKTILNNGGVVAMEKFLVPNKCWQGYFMDTEGNTFGIFQVL